MLAAIAPNGAGSNGAARLVPFDFTRSGAAYHRPFGGLGAAVPPEFVGILDHAFVPFRSKPVVLRLTKSMTQALDYAAGGFHVSVDRGISGGCGDHWSIHKSGTVAAECSKPLFRPDILKAWASAAAKYREAFESGMAAKLQPVENVKAILREANQLADAAFKLEGIAPPKDPGPGLKKQPTSTFTPTEITENRFSTNERVALAGAGILAVGLAAIGIGAAMRKRKRKGRPSDHM